MAACAIVAAGLKGGEGRVAGGKADRNQNRTEVVSDTWGDNGIGNDRDHG
jgi:hypothetical protein